MTTTPRRAGRRVVAALRAGACALSIAHAVPVLAQRAAPPSDAPSCLRFRFGSWTPALDWSKAGHPGTPDSFRIARAEQGQAWAAGVPPTPRTAQGDTVLMLFPSFWPVGVLVSFNPRAFASADTVRGAAQALVADGAKQNPSSVASLWRVPCESRR